MPVFAFAAFAATTALAETFVVPFWSQDFEDTATYANELKYGRVACQLLGITAAEPQDLTYTVKTESWETGSDSEYYTCTISPETRTRLINGSAVGSSTYMRGCARGKTDIDLMFILPTETKERMSALGEYILEFDYYLGPSFTNNNSATNGLVVATSAGNATAVFCTKPKNDKNNPSNTGEIYASDSLDALAKNEIQIGKRGTCDTNGLWVHFSIHASEAGVFMSATQENGSNILQDTKIGDAFAVIDRLYMRAVSKSYEMAASLDDVSVSEVVSIPDEGRELVWTNGSGDGEWSNAANWSVNGHEGLVTPRAADTVAFPSEGAPWAVALDSDVTVTNFVANGEVSISNALVYTGKMGGDAPVTLAGNAGFHTVNNESDVVLKIPNDIVVVGSGNKFKTYGSNSYMNGGTVEISGSVTGNGEISFEGKRSTFKLQGNWMDFAGTVNVVDDGVPRNATQIHTPLATSSNAVWNVYHSNSVSDYFLRNGNQRYYFGALNGYVHQKTMSYNSWLEIGALGIDCSFGGQLGATRRNNIDKVGAGKLTFTGSHLGNLDIHGGTFVFGGPSSIAADTIRFLGDGTLAVDARNQETGEYLDPSPYIKNSTFPVCFSNAVGEAHTWISTIDASNKGGLLKLGAGTLQLAKKPRYSGKTVVQEGTLVVPSDTVFEDGLEVADGASLIYAAMEYVWTGAAGDGRWANPANWSVDGEVAAIAPGSGNNDSATFPADGAPWEVALESAASVTNFVANGAVSLSGALVYAAKVEGDAQITLAGNAGFHTASRDKDAVLEIANDIAVAGGGNKFQAYGSDSYMSGGKIILRGTVTGDGEISFAGKRSTFEIRGNWTDFAGTVNIVDDGVPRNATMIFSPDATSSNAVWNVYNSGNDDDYFLRESGQRYYFGALNGNVYQKKHPSDAWMEIGALGIDCSFGGEIGGSGRNHIDKVGGGTLTFTGSGLGNLDIRGGTFVFGGANSMTSGEIRFQGDGILAVNAFANGTTDCLDPSPYIKNSTFPVCFSNAVGEAHVWSETLDSSNTGGFAKRGAGTLILKKKPKLSGATIVEEGTLVVPAGTVFEGLTVRDGASVEYEEPDLFVWTGAATDDAWSNPGNWEYRAKGGDGDVVASATAIPGAEDHVRFVASDTPWDVILGSGVAVAGARFDGNVRFTGAGTLTADAFTGKGRIILAGAGLKAGGWVKTFDFNNDIEIEDGTENEICAPSYGVKDGDDVQLNIRGRLSGNGTVTFTLPNDRQRGGTYLWGDNTGFTGIGVFSRPALDRSSYRFMSPKSTGTGARWNVGKSPTANGRISWYIFNSSIEKEWEFGAIDGTIFHYNANSTPAAQDVKLVIGSRPEDSRLGGTWASARGYSSGCGVEWVSETNTLTYSTEKTAFIRISGGGTVVVASEAALPIHSSYDANLHDDEGIIFSDNGGVLKCAFDVSGVLRESSAPICFDDEGNDCTWRKEISSSNTAGFTKRGEGTLTLALPPRYDGLTTVESGRMVVSNATRCAVGRKTRSAVDESGTVSIEPSDDDAAAMAGVVSCDVLAAAVDGCLANPALVLTLLEPADGIAIPFGASIRIRSMGNAYSFAVNDRCRIDKVEEDGVETCAHVLDIVGFTPPQIPNAALSAATNGVELAVSDDGCYNVLRGERVDFTWTADVGYTLNAASLSRFASGDMNTMPDEELPFAMSDQAIADGTILRLTGAYAPSSLTTLSIETSCTLRLAQTLNVSNIVFTAGSRLTIQPGDGLGDGDTLIVWQSQHSLNGFALSDDALDKSWTIRSESDGLKLYQASRCSLYDKEYPSMEEAFAASHDGDTVRLEIDSWLFDRIDIPPGESRTIDLGGHTLKVASVWAVNVGDGALAVANGDIVCRDCGFYICDGSLSIGDCDIAAARRVAQVRGAGRVDVSPDATLTTAGDDPVVFAIGGFNGRAEVVSRGRLVQACGKDAIYCIPDGGGNTTAYCVAGNPDDTFGANFLLEASSGAYFTSTGASCLYHPFSQGGQVEISGGWFEVAPDTDWLADGLALREARLDGIDGWIVIIGDDSAAAAILSAMEDAESLRKNIVTADEYELFREWVEGNSTYEAMTNSRCAWMAFALDAPGMIDRIVPPSPDDVEIVDFAHIADTEDLFALKVGLRDVVVGDAAQPARLVKVFGIEGASTLEPSGFNDANVTTEEISPDDGNAILLVRPAASAAGDGKSFFFRVKVNR